MRYFTAAACAALAACAPHVHSSPVQHAASACSAKATQIIAQNADLIVQHRYARASAAAEHAARVSLACSGGRYGDAFADRWRGANALVVAAELAHEAHQNARANALLHEGYTIMNGLRPPQRTNDVTSTLLAQKLGTARQDLAGQWAYW